MTKQLLASLLGLSLAMSVQAEECQVPTADFVKELKSFLTDGADFEKIVAVKSQSHRNMYYVAVYLKVTGASGWAMFASNKIDGFGQMYAVDDIANDFSDLLDGRKNKGKLSASDPSARKARSCLDSM